MFLFNSKYKDILKQIDSAFIELNSKFPLDVWDELRASALALVRKSSPKDVVSFFDRYSDTPRIWAITFCSNESGDIVSSGREHVYRGLLSIRGEAYYKAFEYSTALLVKEGVVSQAAANRNIEVVLESIRNIG